MKDGCLKLDDGSDDGIVRREGEHDGVLLACIRGDIGTVNGTIPGEKVFIVRKGADAGRSFLHEIGEVGLETLDEGGRDHVVVQKEGWRRDRFGEEGKYLRR